MQVSYIFHSGFLLETAQSYYLIDYYKGEVPALDPLKPVVVFASHAHRDHYNPEIFTILAGMGVRTVLAVLSKDIPQKVYPPAVDVLTASAGQTYTLPHGERLETLRSTDKGVAFLLTTAEGTVYHAGDLNDWTWEGEPAQDNREMRGNYRHEIDKLRGREIDVAFLPLDPRQKEHYADGMLYFLAKVGAKCVYPMHYWAQSRVIERFLAAYPQYADVVQRTEPVDWDDAAETE